VTVAEVEWKNAGAGASSIELDLLIANQSKSDLVFPTFDTFGVLLKRADGTEIPPEGGRDRTAYTRPVLISAGSIYCVRREAQLRWDNKNCAPTLIYDDGTGASWSYGPLKAGKYKISFWSSTANGPGILKKSLVKYAVWPAQNVPVLACGC
jgi:hypothetical protein